jgi:hypothetical protein
MAAFYVQMTKRQPEHDHVAQEWMQKETWTISNSVG